MRVDSRVGLFVALSFLGLASQGYAQTLATPAPAPKLERSFDLQLFHPAVGARSFITLDSADVLEHLLFHVGIATNYALKPLTFSVAAENGAALDTGVKAVRHVAAAEWMMAIGLFDRFEVGLALPYTYYLEGDRYDAYARPTGGSAKVQGLGDLRVEAKGYLGSLGEEREVVLGASVGAMLPTGDEDNFMGEKKGSARARVLLEYLPTDSFRAAAMVGGLFRFKSEFLGTRASHAVLFGAAVEYRLLQGMTVLGEATGRWGGTYVDANPAELDAGFRFQLPAMFHLLMGAGAGLNQGVGSPSVRAFLGIGYAPDYRDRDRDGIRDAVDRCPDEGEDWDGFEDQDGCPDPDNDFDGVPDGADRCGAEAEDADLFQDEDGCPEKDNDGDGYPDLQDACPLTKEDGAGKRPTDGCPSSAEDSDGDGIADGVDQCLDEPEDKDGFQDRDGCPDFDNDADGVPDAYDLCPVGPEDFDKFEDNDGCPDPDNDRDGLADGKDKCPNQPETLNGSRDEDGCPDAGPEWVRLSAKSDRIWIRPGLRIGTDPKGGFQLDTEGNQVLQMVARILVARPELVKIRVDVRGEVLGQEDALARARYLVDLLTRQGVEASRLKAWGNPTGSDKIEIIIEAKSKPKLPSLPLPTSLGVGPSTVERKD